MIVLNQFKQCELGKPLTDIPLPTGWLERALVQEVTVQAGIWHIHYEFGITSLFSIYPSYDVPEDPNLGGISCVIIKIDAAGIDERELSNAFAGKLECPVHLLEVYIYRAGEKKGELRSATE